MPSKFFEISENEKIYTVNVLSQLVGGNMGVEISVSITFAHKGRLHRENDLPAILKFRTIDKEALSIDSFRKMMSVEEISSTTEKYWYNNGLIYRDNDQPCHIISRANKLIHQEWGYGTKNKTIVEHRVTGPSSIYYDEDGIVHKKWCFHGKTIPENIPRMENGKLLDSYKEIDIIKTVMNFSREYGLIIWEQYVKSNQSVSEIKSFG